MRIVLDKGAVMPTRAHETDAGLDLYARERKFIRGRSSAVFDTGVHIELPSEKSNAKRTAHFTLQKHSGQAVVCAASEYIWKNAHTDLIC